MYLYVQVWITARSVLGGLTCMSDALILGSFSVTSPWCLQNQCWKAQRHREGSQIHKCSDWNYLFSLLLLLTDIWLFCLKCILGSEECFWEANENFCPAEKWTLNLNRAFLSIFVLFFNMSNMHPFMNPEWMNSTLHPPLPAMTQYLPSWYSSSL